MTLRSWCRVICCMSLISGDSNPSTWRFNAVVLWHTLMITVPEKVCELFAVRFWSVLTYRGIGEHQLEWKCRQGKRKPRAPYKGSKKGSNPDKEQSSQDLTTDELTVSEVNCGVCTKKIIEQSPQNPSEEAVFCEGQCKSWLHRQCAGLNSIYVC